MKATAKAFKVQFHVYSLLSLFLLRFFLYRNRKLYLFGGNVYWIAGMSVLADELDNFTFGHWSTAAADGIFHNHVQHMHSVCDMSPCA